MKYLYPQGKNKAVTFSFDDGQCFDRKLVELLNKYDLKATFNLNSGSLGIHLGYYETLDKEEIKTLFEKHEVACHGVTHQDPWCMSCQKMLPEIWNDRMCLEALSGSVIKGMAYGYGHYNEAFIQAATASGIKYARTTAETGEFYLPEDFMKWNPSCHCIGKWGKLVDEFLNQPPFFELPLLYVWGHSYDLNNENGWSNMESQAKKLSEAQDIWYATNQQIYEYIQAVRNLDFSADGKFIYNPSAVTVWIQNGDLFSTAEPEIVVVKPGNTYSL